MTSSLALAFGGCDACEGPPPPPPEAKSDAGLLDLAPEPAEGELTATWERATQGLTRGTGEAFAIAYSIPRCSVRYELRSVVLSEVAEGRPPAGVEVVAELVGNPDTERLTFQLMKMRSFLLHDGAREERDPSTRGTWPPALVRTDGEVWFEEQGPGTLWAAHSAVPPLVAQFPKLAKGAGVGDAYTWTVNTYSKRTTTKVEKRRETDPDAGLPNFTPDSIEVAVKVEAFEGLTWKPQGQPRSMDIAVLTGAWTTERTVLDPIESQRAERWKARWVVSKSGRLVHAVALAGKYQWWATSPKERNSKLGSAEWELRLVEDCDAPILPRFP